MDDLIFEVKKKLEFQEIPDSIVKRVLELKEIKRLNDLDKVKQTRAILRKYYTVFMTNKLLKDKLDFEEVLKKHISSKDRDYEKLYSEILEDSEIIFDLGAGLNGFSFPFIKKIFDAEYIAVEAKKVFVDKMNRFFVKNNFNAVAFQEDLFNLENILKIINSKSGKKIVFLFKVVDALEFLERDYSKKLISELSKNVDKIVLSYSLKSISGKSLFQKNRDWLLWFLKDNFEILKDFELNGERYIVFSK
jgi:hypothetical protein